MSRAEANKRYYRKLSSKQERLRKFAKLAVKADKLVHLATRQGWPGERGPASLTVAFLDLERAVLDVV